MSGATFDSDIAIECCLRHAHPVPQGHAFHELEHLGPPPAKPLHLEPQRIAFPGGDASVLKHLWRGLPQVLHDVWLTEGYSSDMYNLTQRATYPLASYIEGDIAERSVYQLGFGHVFGHHTSIPLLLRVCNVNILPSADDGTFNRTADYIDGHWRQVLAVTSSHDLASASGWLPGRVPMLYERGHRFEHAQPPASF